MGFLEDLQKAADSVVNVGRDAGAALDQATRNTLQFAQSGVAGGKVFGPLAEKLGKDPGEFMLNLASKTRQDSIKLLKRVQARTGKLAYTFSTPQGQRKVTASPASSANANQVALTLALAALDAPATMAEEAGRMANGLPVKERGLQGYTVYPLMMPAGGEERGLFGIDDAAILAIAVPIIAAIAVNVLPMLISAASNVISEVTKPKGPTPEQAAQEQAAQEQAKQDETIKTAAIIGAVVLFIGGAAFLLLRKRKA